MNTVQHSDEILTGKLWRQNHSFFKQLPFYSNIPRIEEMAKSLEMALPEGGLGGYYKALLIIRGFSIPIVPLSNSILEI